MIMMNKIILITQILIYNGKKSSQNSYKINKKSSNNSKTKTPKYLTKNQIIIITLTVETTVYTTSITSPPT